MIISCDEAISLLERLKDGDIPVAARMRTVDGSHTHVSGFVRKCDDEGIFVSAEEHDPSGRRGLVFSVDGCLSKNAFEFGDVKEILEQPEVRTALKQRVGEIYCLPSENHKETSWLAAKVETSGSFLAIFFNL